MFPSLVLAPLWVFGAITLLCAQLIIVGANAIIILTELVAMRGLAAARAALRWVAWPLPSKWRHHRRITAALARQRAASTFNEWVAAATELDALDGSADWRATPDSDEYDAALVRGTTERLRRARHLRDIPALTFALSSVMDHRFGGIDNPALYSRSRIGTKHAIEAFIAEVQRALYFIAESPSFDESSKLRFFEGCRVALGRTALALSGGGALALAHAGVVRTLISHGLLPRVVSGTSGGSIVVALMALLTDEELLETGLTPSIVSRGGAPDDRGGVGPGPVRFFEPLGTQLWHFVTSGLATGEPRLVDSAHFSEALRAYFGDATFADAYARTGRIAAISITVRYSGSRGGQYNRPLVLNYLSTPQVLLWSAVASSCAAPGLMRPVTLMARDHHGRTVPYHPVPNVSSLDGSMASDLPLEALGLLFRATRSIVSQTNPHVVPFLAEDASAPRTPFTGGRGSGAGGVLSSLMWAVEVWLNLDVRQRTSFLAKMKLLPRFFGADVASVFLQKYSGDVTIVPAQGIGGGQWRALSQPTEDDMRVYISEGERATWPHLSHIRTLVGIEKTLSVCARRFSARSNGKDIGNSRPRVAQPAPPTARSSTKSGGGAAIDVSKHAVEQEAPFSLHSKSRETSVAHSGAAVEDSGVTPAVATASGSLPIHHMINDVNLRDADYESRLMRVRASLPPLTALDVARRASVAATLPLPPLAPDDVELRPTPSSRHSLALSSEPAVLTYAWGLGHSEEEGGDGIDGRQREWWGGAATGEFWRDGGVVLHEPQAKPPKRVVSYALPLGSSGSATSLGGLASLLQPALAPSAATSSARRTADTSHAQHGDTDGSASSRHWATDGDAGDCDHSHPINSSSSSSSSGRDSTKGAAVDDESDDGADTRSGESSPHIGYSMFDTHIPDSSSHARSSSSSHAGPLQMDQRDIYRSSPFKSADGVVQRRLRNVETVAKLRVSSRVGVVGHTDGLGSRHDSTCAPIPEHAASATVASAVAAALTPLLPSTHAWISAASRDLSSSATVGMSSAHQATLSASSRSNDEHVGHEVDASSPTLRSSTQQQHVVGINNARQSTPVASELALVLPQHSGPEIADNSFPLRMNSAASVAPIVAAAEKAVLKSRTHSHGMSIGLLGDCNYAAASLLSPSRSMRGATTYSIQQRRDEVESSAEAYETLPKLQEGVRYNTLSESSPHFSTGGPTDARHSFKSDTTCREEGLMRQQHVQNTVEARSPARFVRPASASPLAAAHAQRELRSVSFSESPCTATKGTRDSVDSALVCARDDGGRGFDTTTATDRPEVTSSFPSESHVLKNDGYDSGTISFTGVRSEISRRVCTPTPQANELSGFHLRLTPARTPLPLSDDTEVAHGHVSPLMTPAASDSVSAAHDDPLSNEAAHESLRRAFRPR